MKPALKPDQLGNHHTAGPFHPAQIEGHLPVADLVHQPHQPERDMNGGLFIDEIPGRDSHDMRPARRPNVQPGLAGKRGHHSSMRAESPPGHCVYAEAFSTSTGDPLPEPDGRKERSFTGRLARS